MTKHGWAGVTGHRLFWPLVAMAALLVGNAFFTPGFLSVQMKQGHLYGSLIDILNFGAPLILVALGMTVVIATKGIDLSVGAVVAISGALACLRISGLSDQGSVTAVLAAVGLALLLSLLLGASSWWRAGGSRSSSPTARSSP
jgi:ribose/xylose/arabinose/galactoside ABC-type transport system permease subunit